MVLISIYLLVIIIIAAFVTSVVASMYAYIYLRKVKELGKTKVFDSDTVEFVQKELKSAVAEAISEIEPKVFADKKLNDLIHHKLNETLTSVKDEALSAAKIETSEFHKDYSEAISELKEIYKNSANGSIKGVEEIIKSEFTDFREILKDETVSAQKIIEGKIEEAFDSALREVEEYKKQRINLVNKQIEDKTILILKSVLGESLTLEDHEKLIKTALDKANKNGLFTKA